MTFLPIVERELRQRARWRSTYWIRGMAAFLASGIVAFVLMFVAVATPAAAGKVTLDILGWLAFLFVIFEGLRNTADALSREKREGTLGLLFLTDLRGYDVVLGKFFASSLTSFYALIAIVPALAVPVLLGGVTGAEFWRLVLALTGALFFSLTAGMFVSSFSRDERRAWTGTLVLLGCFVVLLPIAAGTFNILWLQRLSPFTAFWLSDATRYAPNLYRDALLFPHLLSWAWLALASFLLPRLWQETGARRTHRRSFLPPEKALQRRRRMLAVNPMWWLTSRHLHQRAWLWTIVTILCFAALAGFIAAQNDPSVLGILFGLAILVHFGIAVWVASEACSSFAEARSSGAFELLLSTPLRVREILRGQQRALRELFLPPLALLLTVEVLLVAAHISGAVARTGGTFESVFLVFALGFSMLWFVLDLFAVAQVGMWFGLTSQSATQALTKTVLYVLILPLLAAPCCFVVTPGLMVAKSVIFFTWAQSKLETEFRRAATERFDKPGRSWFSKTPGRLRMPG